MNAIEQPVGQPVSSTSAAVAIEIPEGLEALARRYLASRQNELSLFLELLKSSDFAGIRRMGHNLKGTGTSYGFVEISRLGAALELASTEQNEPEVARQLDALSTYVLAAIQQMA